MYDHHDTHFQPSSKPPEMACTKTRLIIADGLLYLVTFLPCARQNITAAPLRWHRDKEIYLAARHHYFFPNRRFAIFYERVGASAQTHFRSRFMRSREYADSGPGHWRLRWPARATAVSITPSPLAYYMRLIRQHEDTWEAPPAPASA